MIAEIHTIDGEMHVRKISRKEWKDFCALRPPLVEKGIAFIFFGRKLRHKWKDHTRYLVEDYMTPEGLDLHFTDSGPVLVPKCCCR